MLGINTMRNLFINRYHNLSKRYIYQIEFTEKIKNFTKHNISFIDNIKIKITNPNKLNIFNNHIYKANIWFIKKDMNIIKDFGNNNIDNLFNDISNFINKEIKL